MAIHRFLLPGAMIVALALAPSTASAQRGHGGNGNGNGNGNGGGGGRHADGGAQGNGGGAGRREDGGGRRDGGGRSGSGERAGGGERSDGGGRQNDGRGREDGRTAVQRSTVVNPVTVGGPVTVTGAGGAITTGRSVTVGRPVVVGRAPVDGQRYAVPRSSVQHNDGWHNDGQHNDGRYSNGGRTVVVSPGYRHNAYVRSGRPVVVVHRFARPYYAFRPRYHTSFGLFIGFPVAYPFAWMTSYGYPVSPFYPYAPPPPPGSGYVVAPEQTVTIPQAGTYSSPNIVTFPSTSAPVDNSGVLSGGVSFEITPGNAEIYVDGVYVGTTEDFAADRAPLTLAPGQHHVDLLASGYRTMSFDVSVAAGEVIPYEGSMEPLR